MELKNEDLKIYGKIVSTSTEGVVAEAEQIYDDSATTPSVDTLTIFPYISKSSFFSSIIYC